MNLRDRLRAISSGAPESRPAEVSRGLVVREAEADIGDGLVDLPEAGLHRMGWEGAWPDITKCLFLDTETTGLSGGAGTLAFMVGLGWMRNGRMRTVQYMLRDYPDETDMLEKVAVALAACEAVVTFNGKTFDMPLLQSRFTMQRMREMWPDRPQMDLLHPSKRLWKRRLGSCRLSVLEEQVLRRGREDDLPGSEAPQRFFEYLKTGDMAPLEDVLRHNRLDIVSLAALLRCLANAYADPARQEYQMDLYSMGRAMEKRGETVEAKECYRMASRSVPRTSVAALRAQVVSGEAGMALSLLHRREGDYESAEGIWRAMAEKGQMGATPRIELSKLYEHKRKRPDLALAEALAALPLARDIIEAAEIQRRIDRLEKKTRNNMPGGNGK